MTQIESEKVLINRSNVDVFNFLSDFTHFNKLIPPQISNWHAETDKCSFSVQQNLPEISIKIDEKIPYSQINFKSDTVSPIDFTIICVLNQNSDKLTEIYISFVADFPPMIKMMASKPVKNLIDSLVKSLKEFAENNGF
jgi:carbon monoxide dehydrogenase subunit G